MRWTHASWLVPLLFALGVFVALANDARTPSYRTYGFANASRMVILVGPVLAAACALAFARLDRAISALRPTRHQARWIPAAMWPLLLGGPLAGVAAMIVTLRAIPGSLSEWQVVSVTFACLLACGVLGTLVSKALPLVVAVPVVGLGVYAWLALPATTLNATLRFMNGSFVDCCGFAYRPAPGMVAGSLGFAVTVTVCGAVLTSRSSWWRAGRPGAAAGVVLALASAVGLSAAAVQAVSGGAGLPAVTPRRAPVDCASAADGARVCVWPENRDLLAAAVDNVDDLQAKLTAISVPTPRLITEQIDAADALVVTIPNRDDNLIKVNLVQGLLASVAEGCTYPEVNAEYQPPFIYFMTVLGVSTGWLNENGYSTSGRADAAALAAAGSEKERAGVKSLLAGLAARCDRR